MAKSSRNDVAGNVSAKLELFNGASGLSATAPA
jgi:hypothetical protein